MNLFKNIFAIMMLGIVAFSSCKDDEKPSQTPLSKPTGVTAQQVGKNITISWNKVNEAYDYTVWRRTNPNSEVDNHYVGTTLEGYIIDDDVARFLDLYSVDNMDFYYYVVAWRKNRDTGEDGIRNSRSDIAHIHYTLSGGGGGSATKPDVPTGVSASQSGSSVYVSWNSVSGATSYNVYRSSSSSGTYSLIGSPSSASYSDDSPLNGDNYYKVEAVNSAGESAQSTFAYCNYSSGGGGTSIPSAPTGVSASQSGSTVIVTWNSVSEATSYRVYWNNSSASGTYLELNVSYGTSYTDTYPSEGYNYYKVTAINSAGESAQSTFTYCNYSSGGGGGGVTNYSPCPVTYGYCSVSSGMMTLQWTAPTTSGCGTPTKAYLRVRHPDTGEYVDLQTLSGSATSASFAYGMWIDASGYVRAGIITENDQGTSGGIPKIYDTNGNQWY